MCTGIWLLAKPPLCGELAVRKVIHHVGHLVMRHVLGAHPARIELAAHLTDQVRAALKRKHPRRTTKAASKSDPVRPSDWIITRSRATTAAPAGISDAAR